MARRSDPYARERPLRFLLARASALALGRGIFWVDAAAVLAKASAMRTTAAAIFIGFAGAATWAASAAEIIYECNFPTFASQRGVQEQDFSLRFHLDSATRDAFMAGNAGLTEVLSMPGLYGITLLEVVPTGVVQTTFIADDGTAVHSRHTTLPGFGTIASQSYGTCATKP